MSKKKKKVNRYDARRWAPSDWKFFRMLLRKSGGQLLTAPIRMDWLVQSGNDAQLWMSGGENKVKCYKEQYYIGTWNVGSMNQGKLNVVKQKMARLNINILGISKLKWMGMGEFNLVTIIFGLPQWISSKEYAWNNRTGDAGSIARSGKPSWGRKWQAAPVFLPEKFQGQRSLVGYRPKNHKQSDTTKWLSMYTQPLFLWLQQEFIRNNRLALIVNKRVWSTVLGFNDKK